MWLDLLCMGMYIPAFRRNEVTGQYLTQIDKHDLRSMGMKSIGTPRLRGLPRLSSHVAGDAMMLMGYTCVAQVTASGSSDG